MEALTGSSCATSLWVTTKWHINAVCYFRLCASMFVYNRFGLLSIPKQRQLHGACCAHTHGVAMSMCIKYTIDANTTPTNGLGRKDVAIQRNLL